MLSAESPHATIDVRDLVHTGGTTLYGLFLFNELSRRAGAEDLGLLARMVAAQQLRASIEVEASWREVGVVAQFLLQRQFVGKAVLHLGE